MPPRPNRIVSQQPLAFGIAIAAAFICGLNTPAQTPSAKIAPPITAMALAPHGDLLLCGSQQGTIIESLAHNVAPPPLPTKLDQVHDLIFSTDGRWLAAAGGLPARQGTLEVWAWADRRLIGRWNLHKDLIYRLAFSADGKRLATASQDGHCKIVDAASGNVRAEFAGHSRPVMAIAFLPGDDLVVSAGVDQTLQVWKSATGQAVRTMDNHTAPINDLALKPQQKEILPVIATVSEDRTVRLWQPTIGRLVRFAKLDAIARTVCWNPEGTALWVGCDDGMVRILDPDSLKVIRTLFALRGRIHALLAHSDGKHILCGGESGRSEVAR